MRGQQFPQPDARLDGDWLTFNGITVDEEGLPAARTILNFKVARWRKEPDGVRTVEEIDFDTLRLSLAPLV